ncbi:MAG: cytochrome oxidase [Acidobacteriota bacterium]|nr:cytochrome oxidase [Acidobacteriota bacterium]
MDILIVTLFVSLLLGVAGLVLFVLRLAAGDFEHGDRLSLLPLEQDEPENSLDEQPARVPSNSGS